MNILPKGTLLPSLLGVVLLLLTGSNAWAKKYSQDLDTLVRMSPDIVEAKLVLFHRQPLIDAYAYRGVSRDLEVVEVLRTYKGTLHSGDKIAVADVGAYEKPGVKPGGSPNIAEGERMVFFLYPSEYHTDRGFAVDSRVYGILFGGLMLMDGGRVIRFEQDDSEGPYYGVYHTKSSGIIDPEEKDFPGMIQDCIQKVDALMARFNAKPSPQDAPWLLQVLRERSAGGNWDEEPDFFVTKAAARLMMGHDYEALLEALQCRLVGATRALLVAGFESPEGREFLLQKIRSDAVPLEKKDELCSLLAAAALGYSSVPLSLPVPGDRSPHGGPTPPDDQAAYQSRIAQLALERRDSPRLCEALVQVIPAFGRRDSFLWHPQRKPDAEKACALLKQLHGLTTDAKVKSETENTYASVLGEPLRE